MTFTPVPVYQLDGSACQGTNCVAASDAMLVSRSTAGRETPTAAHIRTLIGGPCHGLTSDAVRYVNRVFYSLLCQQENAQPWSGLAAASSHRGFILHGSYAVLNHTKYDASRNAFHGNHAIYVQGRNADGSWKVLDPLADGRYVGCPKGYENIPDLTLRSFAGHVVTGSGSALGLGLAMVLFSTTDLVTKTYRAVIPARTKFFRYTVVSGKVTSRVIAETLTTVNAACKPVVPTPTPWTGHVAVHLWKITQGARTGQIVDSRSVQEV